MIADVRISLRIDWWCYPLIRVCQFASRLGVPVTPEQVSDFIGRHGIHAEDRR